MMSSAGSPNTNSSNSQRKFSRPRTFSNDSSSSKISVHRLHKSFPNSRLNGVLKDLKEDIVINTPAKIHTNSFETNEKALTIYGKDEVYIENHGKFVKTPKDILLEGDYKTRTLFLEENFVSPHNSPLDIAISIQKGWSHIGKMLLGILAGLALTEVVLVILYFVSYEEDSFFDYFTVYSIVSNTFDSLYYVLFVISLISLLDWLDLAHVDIRHFVDLLRFRKIWVILLMYTIALLTLFSLSGISDFITLEHHNHFTNRTNKAQKIQDKELVDAIRNWNIASLVKNVAIISGWMGFVCTQTEDFFLLHLMEMKRYDYPDDQLNTQLENHI